MLNTTYKKIFAFQVAAHNYLAKHPDAPAEGEQDAKQEPPAENRAVKGFRRALKRVLAQAEQHRETYKERVEDLDIEHCATEPPDDPNGIIRTDPRGNLLFTKAGIRARNQDRNKLFAEEQVEITPHFAKHVPDDLTDEERRAFAGFVLPEDAAGVDEEEDEAGVDDGAGSPAPDGQK